MILYLAAKYRYRGAVSHIALKLQASGHTVVSRWLTGDLSMHVKYAARDKRTRDISGMVDALFHLIVLAGLIEDDGQIKRLTWGPVKYKTNCIELEITGD